jgi:sialate O-acetylesterase
MDYNGMVAPLGAFGFRAALWYQGESNIFFASNYRTTLKAMMQDWRRQFENPDMPFLIVQVPNYGIIPAQPTASGWADVREAQRLAVLEDSHAALTVNIDIGDATNLHPGNKLDVGRRLAIAARNVVYGEKIPPSGPVVGAVTRRGNDAVVAFRDVTGVLSGRSGNPLGFELCGAAQASCRWADSRIDGASIVLPNAGAATRVRYCWGESPVCTLYDASGLPAGPFEAPIR